MSRSDAAADRKTKAGMPLFAGEESHPGSPLRFRTGAWASVRARHDSRGSVENAAVTMSISTCFSRQCSSTAGRKESSTAWRRRIRYSRQTSSKASDANSEKRRMRRVPVLSQDAHALAAFDATSRRLRLCAERGTNPGGHELRVKLRTDESTFDAGAGSKFISILITKRLYCEDLYL